jgi:hypothetical protein
MYYSCCVRKAVERLAYYYEAEYIPLDKIVSETQNF